jgi:transketolase
MASGSEVPLIVAAGERLAAQGVAVRLVSFPSWELFAEQGPDYQDSVLPPGVQRRLAVEAGISQGWHRWTGSGGAILGVDRYGVSGPVNQVFEAFGLSVKHVEEMALSLLKR